MSQAKPYVPPPTEEEMAAARREHLAHARRVAASEALARRRAEAWAKQMKEEREQSAKGVTYVASWCVVSCRVTQEHAGH